jgi:hypothetical protein
MSVERYPLLFMVGGNLEFKPKPLKVGVPPA